MFSENLIISLLSPLISNILNPIRQGQNEDTPLKKKMKDAIRGDFSFSNQNV